MHTENAGTSRQLYDARAELTATKKKVLELQEKLKVLSVGECGGHVIGSWTVYTQNNKPPLAWF